MDKFLESMKKLMDEIMTTMRVPLTNPWLYDCVHKDYVSNGNSLLADYKDFQNLNFCKFEPSYFFIAIPLPLPRPPSALSILD